MRRNSIPIIYYHSVAPAKHKTWSKKYLTLELKFFEEQLKYFSKNGYKFLKLKDVFELSKDVISNPPGAGEKSFGTNENKIPPPDKFGIRNDRHHPQEKRVCLTFDDGYLDNFIYVYPLLKKYNAKATIFVNPLFVDKKNIVRKTLENYWNNNASLEEINKWGFLSWDEMRLMEQNGIVDIQSHTMTHTKYFVSDKIIGFHHPGADCVYVVGNLFPERLPYYIQDKDFEKLIPYGYPYFEQKSSIIAKKVTIKQSFSHSVIQLFEDYDWNNGYDFDNLFGRIRSLYDKAKQNKEITESVETDEEYTKRVYFELSESKRIIENELNKKVEFCCWPSGDNTEFTHKLALDIGYAATTIGKADVSSKDPTRIFRFALGDCKNNLLLTRLKTHYKLMSYNQVFPYYNFSKVYHQIRYGS